MKKALFFLVAVMMSVFALTSCKKMSIRESTTEDVNLIEYLKKDTMQRFTTLLGFIEKSGYEPFLNAYGTYTLFAPTNDAIQKYITANNLGSASQLSVEQLKELLRFHLLEEEILTTDFNDGKLSSPTMFGQFLITGVINSDGVSSYLVNRQANIVQPNVKVGNGMIQVIDNVLTPATQTLAKIIEATPEYSIFTQALKETGYYDTINVATVSDPEHKWFTVLAETNAALRDTGIQNYAELKARYCNTGDPKNPNDSLHLYVAYHVLPGIKFLADVVMSSSHETLAPLEVVTNKLINKKVYVNDDQYSTIDGVVHEPGIELEQANSDVASTNGVLHRALKHLAIKVRKPFPVYWDLCAEVPELTRLTSIYRKKGYQFDYAEGNAFKDVKWEKSCLRYMMGKGYLGDYWQMGLGTSSSDPLKLGKCEGNSWVEFTTPLLVKGRYNVWFCYYTQNTGKVSAVQASFDSVPLTSALIQFHQKIAKIKPNEEAEMLNVGWKAWAIAAEGSTAARMLGIIDVKVTGRHKIRFELVSGSNSDCNFDMVHFIPLGANQIRPKFGFDGSLQYN